MRCPLAASWAGSCYGVSAPKVAVGMDRKDAHVTRRGPVHRGECGERYTHVTWSDDVVLAAGRQEHPQVMALELTAALMKEALGIKWDKVHSWSMPSLESVKIRGRTFAAENDLTVFGVSAITGGVR